ncbi:hypothetical protein GC194_11580 [bacterium]|nr:hypothetical protein [bacterium]
MRTGILVLLLGCFMYACGPDSAENKERNVVVSHILNIPETLHPVSNHTQERLEIFSYIHGYMVREDIISHDLVPEVLAEMPQFNKTSTSYRCKVNPAARFDDGSEVTSADIAFSIKANLCMALNDVISLSTFYNMSRVEIIDPHTLDIFYEEANIDDVYMMSEYPVLQASFYDSANVLGSFSFAQMKQHYDSLKTPSLQEWVNVFMSAKYGTELDNINGLGAYKIVKWDESGVVLSKKEQVWQQDNGYAFAHNVVDDIVLKYSADYTARMLDLKNHLVDVSMGFNSKELAELTSDTNITNHYNVNMEPLYSHTLIALNLRPDVSHRTPYFADPLVRKALAHLIPIDLAMEKLSNGTAIRVTSSISPNKAEYNRNLTLYDYNRETALKLLAEAGWTDSDNDGVLDKLIDGKKSKLSLVFLCPPAPLFQAVARMFCDGIREAGIEVTLESPENWREVLMKEHNFDCFLFSINNSPGPSYPFPLFDSEEFPMGNNFSGYENPVVDSLMGEAYRTFDLEKRKKMLFRIQEILHNELPYIYISTGRRGILVSNKYKNVQCSGVMPFVMLNSLELKTDE